MRDIIKYAESGEKHMNSYYDLTMDEMRHFIKAMTLAKTAESAYFLSSLIFHFGYEAGYRARTADERGKNEAQTH